jgi:hypothetical protein
MNARKAKRLLKRAECSLSLVSSIEMITSDGKSSTGTPQRRNPMAACGARGKSLASLDVLIAAQAIDTDATPVSADRGFEQVRSLRRDNWSLPCKIMRRSAGDWQSGAIERPL